MIQIDFDREELEAICRRRAVRRLALFGSVISDDFGPNSDVDVLVEWQPDFEGKKIYLIYEELETLFGGRKVDVVNPKFLNPRIRGHILENTEEVYAA